MCVYVYFYKNCLQLFRIKVHNPCAYKLFPLIVEYYSYCLAIPDLEKV